MTAPGWLLFTVDASPLSEAALEAAVDLAQRLDVGLHLLLVIDGHTTRHIEHQAMAAGVAREDFVAHYLDGVADRARRRVPVTTSHLTALDAADAIIARAQEIDAPLIVMASHGHTGLSHLFVGSVTERVVRRSPVRVVVVPVNPGEELIPPGPTPRPAR